MRIEHWLYTIPLRLRSIFRQGTVESELAEEIRDHIESETRRLIADGMTPKVAARTARARFGGLDQIKEECRDRRRVSYLEHFVKDLRYGLRQLRRNPGFAVVAILTLALGIGANTAIFSVVYSVLLRPLPYPRGERLVWLGESTGKATGISVTYINLVHWQQENRSFDDIAAFENADLTMTGRGDAQLTHDGVVTYDFFRLTGARPIKGRLFAEPDDRPGAAPAVVVSGEFWSGMLAGDPNVVGETLALNGKAFQVIGVLKPGLEFFSRPVDLYLPMGLFVDEKASRSNHGSIRALGLLKAGVTLSAARADLDGVMERLAVADPGPENDHHSDAAYLSVAQTGEVRLPLLLLMGAVGLILVLAGANVASLVL
ncbi:MAG TPA: ABC transporter permease, partial [Blastocatellia bacterium]|nr:ABC transporter permease [Blastocatellia bacterium]